MCVRVSIAFAVATLAAACAEPTDDAGDDAAADVATMSEGSAAEAGEDEDEDEGSNDSAGVTESLVELDAWVLDTTVPDVLSADRPATIDCEHGFGPEDGLFEIDTELCNWGAFTQPTLASIHAGDTVEVIVLHDTLYSEDEGAAAHLAVAIGDAMIWETTIAIPAPTGYLRPTITVEQDFDPGTPLHLHVHNHGYNNYRVVDITVTH